MMVKNKAIAKITSQALMWRRKRRKAPWKLVFLSHHLIIYTHWTTWCNSRRLSANRSYCHSLTHYALDSYIWPIHLFDTVQSTWKLLQEHQRFPGLFRWWWLPFPIWSSRISPFLVSWFRLQRQRCWMKANRLLKVSDVLCREQMKLSRLDGGYVNCVSFWGA